MPNNINNNITGTVKFFSKYIPFPSIGKRDFFVEWKNRLLFFILGGLVFMGLIAYIPSLILSINQKLWLVAGLDTLVYLAVLYIAFSKKMSANTKVISCIVIFYFLGVVLLVFLGKEGAGFNWLFVFPLLTSFFYGFKESVYVTLINFGTLVLLTIPVYFEMSQLGRISEYGIEGWFVNAVNFFAISTFFSFALSIIISSINKSLKTEKSLTELLKINQENLAVAKERAEESDRLKSTFLANMSHEIRTPMNSILGFSELLGDPDITPEQIQKFKKLIHLSGEQLVHIIDDIIDISKIELNQLSIKYAPVDIYSCLLEVAEIQQNKIDSMGKDLKLILDVPDEFKNLVTQSDEFRFKQIVNNLVNNSIKYSDRGTITFGYTVKTSKSKPDIEFFVKDTGRGIPMDAQEKIFDRFTQADNVDFKEGTGLGLSITKGLLDLLGGSIYVESEPGKGSQFYFTLPLISTSAGKIPTTVKYTTANLQGKLIYIAEDDMASYYLLDELLKPTKAEVVQAGNGKELLNLISKKTPDLVLLDINMPVMDGFETIQHIRKTHTDLPVIAQTAYAMVEEQRKCLNLGCNDYIAKPIKKDKFFQLLNKFLIL